MNRELDTWIDRRGRAVLDEAGKGFFIYDDGKGWIAIVEVYFNKSKEILMNRTHNVSPATLAKINRTKKVSRRVTYNFSENPNFTGRLISAINEIAGLALGEKYSPPDETKEVVKSEKDRELEAFLKKHQGI